MRAFCCSALTTLLIALPAPAQEETSAAERAETLINAGVALRREHRDAEALEQFRKAYELRPAPRTLAQIALAQQALGKWVDAERDLSEALKSQDDEWIASRASILQRALDNIREHLGFLVVETNVASATLYIDGVAAARLPMEPLRVPAATLVLELRTAEHGKLVRSLTVPAGGTLVQRIEFVVPADRPALSSPATVLTRREPPEKASYGLQRTLGWAFVGAAGTSLAGALVAQAISQRNTSLYNDDRRCLGGQLSRDQRCGSYRGAAESAQNYANLGYAATGALGVAAAVLLFTLPRDRAEKAAQLSLLASPNCVEAAYIGTL